MARECQRLGMLGRYYSGYPAWKLKAEQGWPITAHSWRTLMVYGLLKWVPEKWRARNRNLFLWQDIAFDRWVARNLERADFIHAMPGQARETFRSARKLGIITVLNHATGPVRHLVNTLAPEFARRGLKVEEETPYDAAYFAREEEEYALSDSIRCGCDGLLSLTIAPRAFRAAPVQTGFRGHVVPAQGPAPFAGSPGDLLPKGMGSSFLRPGHAGDRR